jgi:hypothetical protein
MQASIIWRHFADFTKKYNNSTNSLWEALASALYDRNVVMWDVCNENGEREPMFIGISILINSASNTELRDVDLKDANISFPMFDVSE